ncbi:hypothetical protein ACFT0G_06120 [Streptomyces sp. NPDC057020]|uniref:hypothetical protein n=1 Tax=unclassified Streptomyces TaxID=2593676 RepID=UPI003635B010
MNTTASAGTSVPVVDVADELSARRLLRRWMAAQPDLYDQGGALVRWDDSAEGGRGALVVLDADRLADFCADRIDTVKVGRSGDARSVLLPARLAKALCRTEGAGLRPVDGVSRWPLVRPSGTVSGTAGYDAATRRIIAADGVKPVPDRPTGADVDQARALLLDHLWGSFPFVSDVDLSATLAMYATPLLRPFLGGLAGGVPLTIITAPTPGSGKSLLGQIGMDALYGGIELDGGQSGRELQKSVTAAVHRDQSAAFLSVDNWKSGAPVGGEFFARLITSPRTEGRLIGTGTFVSVPNDRSVIVSGNSVRVADDLARRTVFVRLAPDVDRPETSAHGFDYAEEITTRRGEILHALLVLIRGWIAAGAQRGSSKLGNFTAWAGAVEGLAEFAGLPSPLDDRAATLDALDDAGSEYGRFLAAVHAATGGADFRASDITRTALQDLIPRDADARSIDRQIGPRALGRLILRPVVARIFRDPDSGERYTVAETYDRHTKAWRYRVRRIAERAAGALRDLAETARRVVTRTVRVEDARRSWPEVREAARRRREVAEWLAGTGVRVEADPYANAAAALANLNASRA